MLAVHLESNGDTSNADKSTEAVVRAAHRLLGTVGARTDHRDRSAIKPDSAILTLINNVEAAKEYGSRGVDCGR